MNEIWKEIQGYEGFYEVSNYGKVRSIDRIVSYENEGQPRKKFIKGRLLKESQGTNGYLPVSLSKDAVIKIFAIHRLVAIAFVKGFTDQRNHVDHIDGDKHNNKSENLRWCTNRENHNFVLAKIRNREGQKTSSLCREKLSKIHKANRKPVKCIETQEIYLSSVIAAKELGVTKQAIWYSINRGGAVKGRHFMEVEKPKKEGGGWNVEVY